MGRREGLKIPFGITECRFESGSEHCVVRMLLRYGYASMSAPSGAGIIPQALLVSVSGVF